MNRLKEMRKAKDYTQLKMQHLTGIDQSDYSKIEKDTTLLNNAEKLRLHWKQAWIILHV